MKPLKLTTRQVLVRIRKHHPATFEDAKKLGINFRFLGAGVFRETYRVKDTDLIVKFPLLEGRKIGRKQGILHSWCEIRKIERLKKTALAPFLPTVYYYDRRNGVIIMKFYEESLAWETNELLGRVIRHLMRKYEGINLGDIHGDNVRVNSTSGLDRAVLVDLGY